MMFDTGLELRHIVLGAGLLIAFVLWAKIRDRLPGAFGKNVGDAVEIVPTVGMRLEAWVLTPIAVLLIGLFAALFATIPDEQRIVALVVAPLWAGGLVFGLARFAAIRAVRRHAIRYDAETFSLFDPVTGRRETFAIADVERFDPRWFAPDRLHVAGRAFDFVGDAGGAPRFLERVVVETLSPRTDRVPG